MNSFNSKWVSFVNQGDIVIYKNCLFLVESVWHDASSGDDGSCNYQRVEGRRLSTKSLKIASDELESFCLGCALVSEIYSYILLVGKSKLEFIPQSIDKDWGKLYTKEEVVKVNQKDERNHIIYRISPTFA